MRPRTPIYTAAIAAIAVLFLSAMTAPALALSGAYRHGVNITRLFDSPLMQNGSYANPPFAPWRNEISQDELTRLRNAGFDLIRLPVDPGPFLAMDEASRNTVLDEIFDFLNVALRTGFNVIVDLHPRPGSKDWNARAILDALDGPKFTLYEQFAEELAARLQARHPYRLALELMNEPQSPCVNTGGTDWTVFQKQLYTGIRKTTQRLTLVVTGGCHSAIDGLPYLDLSALPDKNLFVMVHYYEPFQFTHQGASWSPYTKYLAGLRYPVSTADQPTASTATQAWISGLGLTGDAYDSAWTQAQGQLQNYFASPCTKTVIGQRLNKLAQWAGAAGVVRSRIILGEFGVMNEGGSLGTSSDALAARATWLHDVSSLSVSRGFGWAVWGYHGAFGIVSDDSVRTLDPSVLSALFGH